MGSDGIEAVVKYKKDGSVPKADAGKDFIDTGITLVTDKPVNGLESITSQQGTDKCY
jgi:fructose transport system substrate-binding protein